MTEIVTVQTCSVVTAIKGFAFVCDESKKRKYSGKFEYMTKLLQWDACSEALRSIEPRFKEARSVVDQIEFSVEGLSGPYRSASRRIHGGVDLTLSYKSDNHLATGDLVKRTMCPGNHGQAIRNMVVQDILEHAKEHGPFTTSNDMLELITTRTEIYFKALDTAKPASDDIDDSEVDDDTGDAE